MVREVTLGRQTGGYDVDGCPGDEALQVVLEPRDPDGQAVKAPGSLHVEAMQISAEGLKALLSSWDVSAPDLRRTWKNGLFATGYYVILPWKSAPATSRLRVVARFTSLDGRVFEADKDITIRLPPGAEGKAVPTVPGAAPRPISEPELPMPRSMPPASADPSGAARQGAGNSLVISRASRWAVPDQPSLARAIHLLPPAPSP
jgi:hypothetical protein